MRTLGACFCGLFRIRDVKAFWVLRNSILSLRKKGKLGKLLAKFPSGICTIIRRRYGAGIPVSEKVQPFATPHAFYGIFISKYATVEAGCTIYQQVTIGQNSFIDPECEGGNAPVVGENCYIGVGAKSSDPAM